MDQGTGARPHVGGELFDAIVAPVGSLALVRDDESGDVTVLSLTDVDCKPLVLSGTAAVIWDEFDGEHSLRDIVRVLASDYGLDEAVIGEQVLSFVTQLLEAQLLHVRGSARDTATAL
ncbi:PqqD family protein [Pseudoclavibacter terrae]|uniref:PqqD family protein n=1 Tax=Pseudoclavibacter terrae TaxID=1530195 RepID=UPI00232D4A1B|nr:PqqD family protein [Pseudoclavibacter terrae]